MDLSQRKFGRKLSVQSLGKWSSRAHMACGSARTNVAKGAYLCAGGYHAVWSSANAGVGFNLPELHIV
jgi:hypothetical protein